jgi:hypothetical protein
MAAISYFVKRNIPATNGAGADCKIAIAAYKHENGFIQTVAINEELLRWECGGDPVKETAFIEREIAMASRH